MPSTDSIAREPGLLGQTVVVIGGSAGIGLETARYARAAGAEVVLTARNPERLEQAGLGLGAQSTAAFDANDPASLERFFQELRTPIDHVLVSGGGPRYKPPLEMDTEEARAALSEHMLLALSVARNIAGRVRPSGALVLIGGTGGRRIRPGSAIVSAVTAAMPALTAGLALEPRADPGESDCARLRRHSVVGFAPRRRSRQAARGTARDAAHRARGRPG